MTSRARLGKIRPAKWLATVLVAAFMTAGVAVAWQGLVGHAGQADLAVVPGNTVYPDGTLSDRLKGRLDAAVHLYHTGGCAAIFVSGAVGVEGVDESVAMQTYLVQSGIPVDRIIQDGQGKNTEATARNAALAMRERGFRTAIAVSQFFHVPRLRLLLQQQGVIVVGTVHARHFEMRDIYSLAREVVAIATLLLSQSPATRIPGIAAP